MFSLSLSHTHTHTHTRKVCKNCLCPREEHDIKEDDNAVGIGVGKLLFAPNAEVTKGGLEVSPSPK